MFGLGSNYFLSVGQAENPLPNRSSAVVVEKKKGPTIAGPHWQERGGLPYREEGDKIASDVIVMGYAGIPFGGHILLMAFKDGGYVALVFHMKAIFLSIAESKLFDGLAIRHGAFNNPFGDSLPQAGTGWLLSHIKIDFAVGRD